MSDVLPVPRFEPSGRAPGPLGERRVRLLALAAGALVLAIVASSVANRLRVGLRCVDGRLVAYQGSLLPAGEEPLDDPSLPPVPVPALACEDEDLDGMDELRTRHRELTRGRIDEALRSDDRVALESTVAAIDAMTDPAVESDAEQDALRELLESAVEAKVQQARTAHQDALRWIERARQAGVDPARLRAAERALGLDANPAAQEPSAPEPPAPSAAPPEPVPLDDAAPGDPDGPRTL